MLDVDRETLAWIVDKIAHDGLPGPRDLDVALDAIIATFEEGGNMSEYVKNFVPYETDNGVEYVNMDRVEAITVRLDKNGKRVTVLIFGDGIQTTAVESPEYFLGRADRQGWKQ